MRIVRAMADGETSRGDVGDGKCSQDGQPTIKPTLRLCSSISPPFDSKDVYRSTVPLPAVLAETTPSPRWDAGQADGQTRWLRCIAFSSRATVAPMLIDNNVMSRTASLHPPRRRQRHTTNKHRCGVRSIIVLWEKGRMQAKLRQCSSRHAALGPSAGRISASRKPSTSGCHEGPPSPIRGFDGVSSRLLLPLSRRDCRAVPVVRVEVAAAIA